MGERPLTLEITFEGDERVFVSASSYDRELDVATPFADELTIVFDREWVERHGLLAPLE